MSIDDVIAILICPKCSSKLIAEKGYLWCRLCGARYNVIGNRIIDFIGAGQGWVGVFEKLPSLYDPWSRIGWRLSGKGSLQSFYEELVRDLDRGSLVDAGCGTGSLISMLERKGYRDPLIGVDISLSMLREALRKTREAVFLRASIDRIPIADNTIDHYVSSLVLHILEDKSKAVSELSRILKSGGSVRVAVAVTDNIRGRIFSRLLRIHAIRSSEYIELFNSHGIEIIRSIDFGAFKAFYGVKKI